MRKKIMIIVAHPDDETLGCAGTIANHTKNGDKVFCISMTDGISARNIINKKKEILKRKNASKSASKILGFQWLDKFCGNFPDNALDSIKILNIIKLIENAKNFISPNIVYTHSNSDLNHDHRLVYEAVITAFRPQPKEIWDTILSFEVPSSTDYGNFQLNKNFKPNYFVNIEKTWKKKLAALKCYNMEMKKYPHPRSYKGLEILSELRGMQNGMKMAEAFQIIKKIKR